MQGVTSSWASASASGGHRDDHTRHRGNAAAAISEVLRDFTWYSAMLLSHLFALEHAQLVRAMEAEERRISTRAAAAHSPQLLISAAVEAAKYSADVPQGSTAATAAETPRTLCASNEAGGRHSGSQSGAPASLPTQSLAPPANNKSQKLSHLPTQHRPHILMGFSAVGDATTMGTVDVILADSATRWAPPPVAKVTGASSAAAAAPPPPPSATGPTATAKTSTPDSAITALLAVFDAYYFPSELFHTTEPVPSTVVGGHDKGGDDGPALVGADVTPVYVETDSAEPMHEAGATSAGTSAGRGSTAPRVTADALREAFHDLLVLGQRCAVFALTYRGIIGCGGDPAVMHTRDGSADLDREENTEHRHSPCMDDGQPSRAADTAARDDAAGTNSSSEDDASGDEAVQKAASASLQFLLQLACSCPCAALAYAAQLCVAHALAVQPQPRSSAGWCARQQLLRYLPTLQPQCCATSTPDAGVSSAGPGGPHQNCSLSGGSGLSASATSSTSNTSYDVPATQYIRPEDAILWFDSAGEVHLMTAQWWWDTQQRQQSAPCFAYCSPLPTTTALPTVQRLLMEEEAYMGPKGSAVAALKSLLESVSTEISLNAHVITGSPISRVHTSLRRRRDLRHGGGGGGGGAGGGECRSVTGGSAGDASEEHGHHGSPASAGAPSALSTARGPGSFMGRAHCDTATGTPRRLSKAAKRRRALLFALAQSHLLPPLPLLATSKTLLYGVFTDGGECPSYYKLLSLYPEVLRAHHAALHYVLFEDGPLSVDVRLMVASMAASRHRCEYLVSRFSALLLRYAGEEMLEEDVEEHDRDTGGGSGMLRGDHYGSLYNSGNVRSHVAHADREAVGAYDDDSPNSADHSVYQQGQQHQQPINASTTVYPRGRSRHRWITQGPPTRLRAVQHFIALAAHTPWTLVENEVRSVLAQGWTIPEVFQLVAIVAQVVPLCGFVMGLFVPAEPWAMTLLPLEVVERLGHRAVTEDAQSSGQRRLTAGAGGDHAGKSLGCLSPSSPPPHYGGASGFADETCNRTRAPTPPAHKDVYRRFAGDDNVVSEQRIRGGAAAGSPQTLWRSQFTWNEVGATSMEQYYPGAATLLNEEIECYFDVVRQLTKADCVGLMSPEYSPSYAFRSLHLYVQNLVGFMVEDYPYNDINKVLRRPAKWFAQVLTMRPETLSRSEVLRWYVPTIPLTGKTSDMSPASSLVTHQLKREIELLSVVDSAQGGHRGGIEAASAHPDDSDAPPPTPAEAAREAAEVEALQTALTLQDERVLLLIALATMVARKEGLLHILLRPVCAVLNNM
ncbi:hypothetical protein JKF63_06552 [Porcisia hertigi]|uniref:Uncharacterized protein n=1 Tax=Porcisia hertigi TaxID=2761500 RepID=A0A836IRZ3_9TRYP|nr:hypothetical protein JKF63_06552 [Porcisia hertigi]